MSKTLACYDNKILLTGLHPPLNCYHREKIQNILAVSIQNFNKPKRKQSQFNISKTTTQKLSVNN